MSVQEIETAITLLPPADLADLAQWFEAFHADAWDRQIERDAKAGRFDAVLERVNRQIDAGQVHPLTPDGPLVP